MLLNHLGSLATDDGRMLQMGTLNLPDVYQHSVA